MIIDDVSRHKIVSELVSRFTYFATERWIITIIGYFVEKFVPRFTREDSQLFTTLSISNNFKMSNVQRHHTRRATRISFRLENILRVPLLCGFSKLVAI